MPASVSPGGEDGETVRDQYNPAPVPANDSLAESLARRRLLVVTGKGGVGKTAVAGALARALSGGGRRVLVIEVDPRENLHRMFDLPPSGGEIVAAGDGLWLQNLKPRQVLDAIVRERLRIEAVARRVLGSAVYRHFAEGAPGLEQVAVLGHALRLVRGIGAESLPGGLAGQSFDLVVLDAPATGHGVSLLAAPKLLSTVVEHGPFGEMARDLTEFVADPGHSAVVAVTAAEEMPVEEVLDLRRRLTEQLDRTPELLVVNGLHPPLPERAPAGAAGDPLWQLWRRRRRLEEAELARLTAEWEGPRIELPLLPIDRGPELLAALAARLATGLGEEPWS
jgi:anion-transporting  ArsA/GET3 family ATPase